MGGPVDQGTLSICPDGGCRKVVCSCDGAEKVVSRRGAESAEGAGETVRSVYTITDGPARRTFVNLGPLARRASPRALHPPRLCASAGATSAAVKWPSATIAMARGEREVKVSMGLQRSSTGLRATVVASLIPFFQLLALAERKWR